MKNYKLRMIVVLVLCAFMFTGCAQLKEKFVRKKKPRPGKRYIAVREYDVKPNMELYTKRYIFWKNWHRDLLDQIDRNEENKKKITVAIENEISNLYDMKSMLVDEKGDSLQVIIDKMTGIEMAIKKQGITQGNKVQIRRRLEILGKEVKKDYSYRVIRGEIRDEFREEEGSMN